MDAHVHLDYANTVGRPRLNQSGTLFEAIDIWADVLCSIHGGRTVFTRRPAEYERTIAGFAAD